MDGRETQPTDRRAAWRSKSPPRNVSRRFMRLSAVDG